MNDNGKFYTGYTQNLKKRAKEHQNKINYYSRRLINPKLIYCEACLDKEDAKQREKYLKSGPGKKYIKNRLKNYLNKHRYY